MAEPNSAANVPLVGDVIAGKYRVDSILGEGGMGIVYEAEHLILRQRVAIKALLPGTAVSSEVIERFSSEAATVARLTSEHVVRVMDAGTLPSGSPYLVMEYLAGCDLENLLVRRGPLPTSEVVDFALQALEALAHAHAAGIVHRDLKPANLFLAMTPKGRKQIIKLLDFGISKSLGMTPDGDRVLGSPTYMSPEQLQKNGTIDHRTDFWSLGVVMYELLCGAPPFGGATFIDLIAAIRQATPISLHARDPRIPAGLSDIITRCLRREPADRWSSAADLASALVGYGSGAWAAAIERIDQALAHVPPVETTRRYESFENALQALEAEVLRDGDEFAASKRGGIVIGRSSRMPFVSTGSETLPPSEVDLSPPESRWEPESEHAGHAVTQLPPASLPEPMSRRASLRILLIDDSEIALALHTEILTYAGFEARSASSAAEFDALLGEWKPHLVLMDIMMPGLNGDLLCRRVKARFKATVPVVLLSDLPHDELVSRAQSAGADGYLGKPGPGERLEFLEYIRNICAITYSPEDLP